MRRSTAIFLLLVCIPFTYGASFDCTKASSQVEKIICSNAELSKLDEQLSVAYVQGNAASISKAELKSSQRRWLIEKRNICTDASCVKKAYEERLNEIELSNDASDIGDSSRAASPQSAAMELCTIEQIATLESVLNKPAFAPKSVEMTLRLGECRQLKKSKLLAFAVFFPLKPLSEDENVSIDDQLEQDFKLLAGLFDLNSRRIVSSYSQSFPYGGWIQIYGHMAHVMPTPFSLGKTFAFAISYGSERPANAANFNVGEKLTLLKKQGTSLVPVFGLPLYTAVALTESGGICCADEILHSTRTLVRTTRQTSGMPDLEVRVEREVTFNNPQSQMNKYEKFPATYIYTLQFNGRNYQPSPNTVKDPWASLEDIY
jgi:uncharacterized protein